jgi:aspartyl-tRNA(Asn)/glutamyl-tRNA(Gln) amidotransferase subunit A
MTARASPPNSSTTVRPWSTLTPTAAECMAAIERDNARLNVYVERAAAANASSSGELAGWPVAVKANIAVNGLAFTAGMGAFRARVAKADAPAVAALRAAGAAILGTVNMEEAALGAATDNPHFGRTENPWCAGYTPGGSSGGSAAAVAAGMARVALGTDTMGSCRIPAAYCGVVGFKPSFERISTVGAEPLEASLDHVGVLAHTVSDVQHVFRVLDVEGEANHDQSGREWTRLAVLGCDAISTLDDDVASAYVRATDKLRAAGYTMIVRAVDIKTLSAARRSGLLLCEMALGRTLSSILPSAGDGVSAFLRGMIAFGESKGAEEVAAARARVADTRDMFARLHDNVDAIFWPTAPQSAFAFGTAIPANQADWTCIANFTGAPAISLPMHGPGGAMPVGGQLMTMPGDDIALLNNAARLASLIGPRIGMTT